MTPEQPQPSNDAPSSPAPRSSSIDQPDSSHPDSTPSRGYPAHSAPSPADENTAAAASSSRDAGGWSPDMDRQTGPVPRIPQTDQNSWWQPRPSGAWSAPTYGATGYGADAPAARAASMSGARPRTSAFGAYGPRRRRGRRAAARPPQRPPIAGPDAAPPSRWRPRSRSSPGSAAASSARRSGTTRRTPPPPPSLLTAAPASVQSAPAPAGSVQEVADKVLPSTVSVLASSNAGSRRGVRRHPHGGRPHPDQQPRHRGRHGPAGAVQRRHHRRGRGRRHRLPPTTSPCCARRASPA